MIKINEFIEKRVNNKNEIKNDPKHILWLILDYISLAWYITSVLSTQSADRNI